MSFLRNSITLLSEIVALIFAILWYKQSGGYEALIAIITIGAAILIGILSRYRSRPYIELHKKEALTGRNHRGYSPTNPQVIQLGIDQPIIFFELFWLYELEIRNNSSHPVFSINVSYKNAPPNTRIEGSIGKIEPLKALETRLFILRFSQSIESSAPGADRYLEDNIEKLIKYFKIIITYKDENRHRFRTIYKWSGDKNTFQLF